MSLVNDGWRTPQWMFDWLDSMYNFDIDLCADSDSFKVSNYFTEKDDALTQNWIDYGDIGFCNPPYSNRVEWIDLAIEQAKLGMTTVMIIPSMNGQSYLPKLLEQTAKIIHMVGRVGFVHYETLEVENNPKFAPIVLEFSNKEKMHAEWVKTTETKKKFGGLV